MNGGSDFLYGVDKASRSFVVHHEQGFIVFLLQCQTHKVGRNRLLPVNLDHVGLFAIGLGDLLPAGAEGAVDADEDALVDEVAHGGFVEAGA
jgi:hypothetical protein